MKVPLSLRACIWAWALLMLIMVEPMEESHAMESVTFMPAGPVSEGFPADAVLIYGGNYPFRNTKMADIPGVDAAQMEDGGDWLPAHFRPYVTHLTPQGDPDDTFFDSFVFLALQSNRGRKLHGELGQDEAALYQDWEWYLNRLFTPNKHLDALEQSVTDAETALNLDDYVVNVYIMIPYPSHKITDFGTTLGDTGGDSFGPVENRLAAVQWYVDEVVGRWKTTAWPHLRLAGFYWVQEHVNPNVPGEEELVRGTAKIVHERDKLFGWIPWSGAYLAPSWASFNFDWAVTQPNHMFQKDKPHLLETGIKRAEQSRMGVEIELDGRVMEPAGAQKLYDYLNAGVEHGFMNSTLLGYYQDVYMLARLYWEGGNYRRMYDDVYSFAKGTYPSYTTAANLISGKVIDKLGAPLAGAKVSTDTEEVETDEAGQFQLWVYGTEVELQVKKIGYDVASVALQASQEGEFAFAQVKLDSGAGVVLHSLDSVKPGFRLGVKLSAVTEPKTEGAGALAVHVLSEKMNAFWWDANELAPAQWSEEEVLAIDALSKAQANVQLLLTATDQKGDVYTKSIWLISGEWQIITLPLKDLAAGVGHDEKAAGRPSSGIDVAQIKRLTVSLKAPEGTVVYLDNLRLTNGGS